MYYEKNLIMTDFNSYMLEKTDGSMFLITLLKDKEICKHIIENNFYWDYFDIIFGKFGSNLSFEIFKVLCTNDVNNSFINENMYKLFDSKICFIDFYKSIFNYIEIKNIINKHQFEQFITSLMINNCNNINSYFIEFLLSSKYKDILVSNFDKILKNYYNLFDLKELIKKDTQLLSKYKNYVNNNPDNLIYEIIIKGFIIDLESAKKQKIFDTIKLIITELLEYEKINFSEIELLGEGEYSYVVSIGSKVLKIGLQREKFHIDNNKRFLKPLLRTQIQKYGSSEVLGCIEITEKVDTKNITDEDVYEIYKELRDEGYRWTDCKKENIGRLLRKNIIHFKDIDLSNKSIYYNTNNSEELESGELVIIDNDYIFTEEEFNNLPESFKTINMEMIKEIEERYQNEKRNVK